jgi:hypothetical protein
VPLALKPTSPCPCHPCCRQRRPSHQIQNSPQKQPQSLPISITAAARSRLRDADALRQRRPFDTRGATAQAPCATSAWPSGRGVDLRPWVACPRLDSRAPATSQIQRGASLRRVKLNAGTGDAPAIAASLYHLGGLPPVAEGLGLSSPNSTSF